MDGAALNCPRASPPLSLERIHPALLIQHKRAACVVGGLALFCAVVRVFVRGRSRACASSCVGRGCAVLWVVCVPCCAAGCFKFRG